MKKNFQPSGLLVLSLLYLTEHPATQPDTEHVFLEWQKKNPNPQNNNNQKKTNHTFSPKEEKNTNS